MRIVYVLFIFTLVRLVENKNTFQKYLDILKKSDHPENNPFNVVNGRRTIDKTGNFLGKDLFQNVYRLLETSEKHAKSHQKKLGFYKSQSSSLDVISEIFKFWKDRLVQVTNGFRTGAIYKSVFVSLLESIQSTFSMISGILAYLIGFIHIPSILGKPS